MQAKTKAHTVLSFLLALSTLISCERGSIQSTGYYSKLAKMASRSIASIPSAQKLDPKQYLIYCSVSTRDEKSCFDKLTLEKGKFDFYHVKAELKRLDKIVLNSLQDSIKETVKSRYDFCEENSIHNYKKCILLNLQKNTMAVLNQLHTKEKLNGHEYIYLKKMIRSELRAKYHSILSTKLAEKAI